MEPLSCRNCCHNPLQLGSVGTAFGFCTRHAVVLHAPHLTTCGQLLRKDLRERVAQGKTFRLDRVSTLAEPSRDAASEGLTEVDGMTVPDAVVEEVVGYGLLDSKIATMAALHRIPGVRSEVAMLSLGRGYFQNCVERAGRWTSGVHLLQWTLKRLAEEPVIGATELLGPVLSSLPRMIELAQWQVVCLRLILAADVAQQAGDEGDPLGHLVGVLQAAIEHTQPGSQGSLLRWLRQHEEKVRAAFPPKRYEELRRALHKEEAAA